MMYSFDENIYYNPEAHGYEIIKVIDIDDEPYQFHMLVIWRGADGELYYGIDSGCSCPSPFEADGPDDLLPYNYDEVAEYVRGVYAYERRQVTLEDALDWCRRNLTSVT